MIEKFIKTRDIEPPWGIPPSLIMARVCNIPDVRACGPPIKECLDPRIRSGDESIISELVLLGGTAGLCLQ